jgi:hypothetical protein
MTPSAFPIISLHLFRRVARALAGSSPAADVGRTHTTISGVCAGGHRDSISARSRPTEPMVRQVTNILATHSPGTGPRPRTGVSWSPGQRTARYGVSSGISTRCSEDLMDRRAFLARMSAAALGGVLLPRSALAPAHAQGEQLRDLPEIRSPAGVLDSVSGGVGKATGSPHRSDGNCHTVTSSVRRPAQRAGCEAQRSPRALLAVCARPPRPIHLALLRTGS